MSARRFSLALLPWLALAVLLIAIDPRSIPSAWAQTSSATATGRIAGRVTERGKDPVASANVIALGTKQGAQTDENGSFLIVGVPVGTQQIQAQSLAHGKEVLSVQVTAGQTATVTFNFG